MYRKATRKKIVAGRKARVGRVKSENPMSNSQPVSNLSEGATESAQKNLNKQFHDS